jgi:protein-S-isoprenylcysteine O-methyltransferase Ste14
MISNFYQFCLFLESYLFQAYFLFYTFYNAYKLFVDPKRIITTFQQIAQGNLPLDTLLGAAELLILFFLIIFNFLLAYSLFIRKNLRKAPDSLAEVIVPIIGTFGVGLYNLIPDFPDSWQMVLIPEQFLSTSLVAGCILALAGLTISIRSIYDLRQSFGIFVQVREVVRHGIYSWVRHPMYLGHMTTGLGFLFLQPNLANTLITLTVILANFCRAVMEERKIAAFSPQYCEYQKQVPFFIPIKIRK